MKVKKSLHQELNELAEALRNLFLQIAYALKIDVFADWLTRQLSKVNHWRQR